MVNILVVVLSPVWFPFSLQAGVENCNVAASGQKVPQYKYFQQCRTFLCARYVKHSTLISHIIR